MSDPVPVRIGIDLGSRHAAIVVQPPLGALRSELVRLPDAGGDVPGSDPAAATEAECVSARIQAVVQAVLRLLPGESAVAPRELTVVSSSPARSVHRGDGGPTALLLTEGFTDLLRPELGLLAAEPALSRAVRCLGVPARTGADGAIVRPLVAADLDALRERLRELGVTSAAVALLHSTREPRHEQALGQALARLGLYVALSSEVLAQPHELPRAAAALLDAYVAPRLHAELAGLRAGLSASRLRSVLADGTVRSDARPLRCLRGESAAGLLGAQRVASAHELGRWIGLGSGAELVTAALYDTGFERSLRAEIGGLPLVAPSLLMATRRCGAEVTLGSSGPSGPGNGAASESGTNGDGCLLDAAQQLGRLPAELGRSRRPLERAAAERLWEQSVVAHTAVVREVTIERGHDPAEHTLVCYGGTGPLLGAAVAERLGVTRILVPPVPSRLGALGALCAQLGRERVRWLSVEASGAQQSGLLESTVRALSDELQRDLRAEGITSALPGGGLFWSADLRYQGQAHELSLPGIGEGGPAQDGTTDLVVRFHQEHQRRYGFTLGERPIELVAVRVRCAVSVPAPAASHLAGLYGPADPRAFVTGERSAEAAGGAAGDARLGVQRDASPSRPPPSATELLTLQRQQLQPGGALAGPLLVVEPGVTTYVPPGWRVTQSELGALWLQA
ncbi:MAG: hydantoinase/oxoprolinase family protein [Polyangia bacterium]